MQKLTKQQTILLSQAATGTGATIAVQDWDEIILEVATASSANLTLLVQGSTSETAPIFGSAKTSTNVWDYLAYEDCDATSSNAPTVTAGATGFVFSGTDDVRQVRVKMKGLRWLSATVSIRSAGNVTIKAHGIQNY